MFLKSLQWRLVWIFMAITVSITIVIWFWLNQSVELSYYQTFKKDIERNYNNWEMKDNPSPEEIIYDLRENRNSILIFRVRDYLSITVFDKKQNKIIYSSDSKYNNSNNPEGFYYDILKSKNLNEVLLGSEKGDQNPRAAKDNDGRVFFDYARSKGDFIVYFRFYREEWGGIIDKFNNILLVGCVFGIVASMALGYILSKTITVPIVDIMHKAQRLAAGDFDQALAVKSDDEIGKLTGAFNYMAGELKNTLLEISREKNKIETILNYMTDGIIAFNLQGEVIHANPASRKMLGVGEFDKNFNDFSRQYELGIRLEDVLYLGSTGNKERNVEVDGRYLRVHFVVFTDEEDKAGGVIAVLQDITEQEKLDKMRREFVANVSHELRTPLTSIKSYAETLMDGILEDRDTAERFLSVINSEADRMTRLVKDLLQLSRFDSRQMQWNIQDLSFVDLVTGTVEKMQLEARDKDLCVESYVIGDIPNIKGDRDRIEQVVLNVLSNAVKYTPRGGKITVYIGKIYSDVYMKVVDTGIGIPREDLPRIFERFYRVDKARSREMGGTGLGLSIAREIVEAHGGTISASSEVEKGTEITVSLPVQGLAREM
ncbi:MAG: ATP-binding protein [Clostridiales bacterium]|nr:cell wall metabolism sensor histidine kinase WalK [Eubacteriales bacterium]MDH7565710.1 ATP-binding protein [Clostridiales bacterium]